MSHAEDIKNLLIIHNRQLQKLKEQAAKFGVHTPAFVLTEIEDKEAEIEKLQVELKELENKIESPFPSAVRNNSRWLWVSIGVIVLIIFVASSVIVTYLVKDTRSAPESEVLVIPTHSFSLNLGSGSIKIEQGQMVVLANSKGAAVLRFIFSADGTAYHWRYKEYDSDVEKTGSGQLYENYARTPTAKGSHLVDLGSSLSINIEDMQVNWSFNSTSSGWIYYKSLGIDILDDSNFNALNLADVHVGR